MALSLQRVRELKAHMQTGAQTLEAVSIKLSRQMSAGGDDLVLQRVADIHAPVKLTPVEPTPSHAIEEGPLYVSNLAQRISGSLPELDMDFSHSHHSAFSSRKLAYSDILAHLLQWLEARWRHKHAFLNLHFWAMRVRLIKKYGGCIARASNRRDLTMMTRSFRTWHANVYERQAASEYSHVHAVETGHENAAPPQDDGQDKSLAFPIFKAQQITACRSAPAPPPPPPPMNDSSVEKPLPPAPTGTPAAQTVRWADDSISQITPKGLRTSNSSVGEDGVVSAAQTLVGNEQQVQTAHGVPPSPKTVSPILP
jgi:hypothetical protein